MSNERVEIYYYMQARKDELKKELDNEKNIITFGRLKGRYLEVCDIIDKLNVRIPTAN